MKAINYHIKAIQETFEQLFKGKFLIYFVPGLVITLVFAYWRYKANSVGDSVDLHSDNSWLDWGAQLVNSAVHGTFSFFDLILEQIYIFIVLTALSPFNTSLAEKLDHDLTGFEVKGGFTRFLNDIIRMIFVVIIMIVMELVFIAIYWLISWIFGFPEIMDTIVFHCIAAFFFGLSFYDFGLERYAKGVFATIGFAFSNPLGMIITGSIFLGIYNIPYVGIPLAPVLAVMISTVAYLYYTKKLPKTSNTELKANTNE